MEPLKFMYNQSLLANFATILQRVYSSFDQNRFLRRVFDDVWEQRELKDRMHHVADCLQKELPQDYAEAIAILSKVAPECRGFPYMFFPDFVERHGLAHEEESLQALELFTQYSSSEFAIRPFIVQNTEGVIARMIAWAEHENEHIRRLASEGCRPRLPWAMALPAFQRDPSPILPILEILKQDESEYVRRSVANNLNDIAKDHPDLIIRIASAWKGSNAHTDWIVKHGCRTLFKRGNSAALELWGFQASDALQVKNFRLLQDTLSIGETLDYTFDVISEANTPQNVRIDLAVDYVKAKGSTSRKVFKLSEKELGAGVHTFQKRLRFQDLTTRRHYPGKHRLVVVLNGVEAAETSILLNGFK